MGKFILLPERFCKLWRFCFDVHKSQAWFAHLRPNKRKYIKHKKFDGSGNTYWKTYCKKLPQYKETNVNKCSCATSYKQEIGKEVSLYCKASPSFGNKFRWMLGRKTVSNKQVHKFRVTQGNIRTYFCYVYHENGEVSVCSCDVAITKKSSCDKDLMLNELKIAIKSICKG